MLREQVQSSSLRSIGYDPIAHMLEIEFNHGGIYQYLGVPESEYTGLMTAASLGTYFLSNIRNDYAYRRVE